MDAHNAGARGKSVQRGAVAESYQPFGILLHELRGQRVYEVDGAVAAAVAQDGLDGRVCQGPLQVGEPLLGRAGIVPEILLVRIGACHGLESPVPEDHSRRVDVFVRSVVGRGNQGNRVAGVQETGLLAGKRHPGTPVTGNQPKGRKGSHPESYDSLFHFRDVFQAKTQIIPHYSSGSLPRRFARPL